MTRHKSRGFGYSIEGGANRAFTVYAQQALNINARGLASLTQQLSTGKRINNSVDDIAGMAISTRLTSQIRGLNQAIRNAYDGLSLMQTAEAATEQVTNMLQRMRELATQASNDTNNSSDRTYLDFEMHTLKAEVNRVAASTQWSGGNILDGKGGDGSGNFSFQVGANAGQRISAKLSSVRTDKALNATTAVSDTVIYTPNSLSTGDGLRVDITGIANIYVQKGANNHSGEAMSTDAAVLTEMAYQLNQNFGTLTGNSDARPYAEVVGSTLKITKIDSTLLAVKTLATTGGPSVTVGGGAAATSNPTVASTPLTFTLTSLDSAYGSAASAQAALGLTYTMKIQNSKYSATITQADINNVTGSGSGFFSQIVAAKLVQAYAAGDAATPPTGGTTLSVTAASGIITVDAGTNASAAFISGGANAITLQMATALVATSINKGQLIDLTALDYNHMSAASAQFQVGRVVTASITAPTTATVSSVSYMITKADADAVDGTSNYLSKTVASALAAALNAKTSFTTGDGINALAATSVGGTIVATYATTTGAATFSGTALSEGGGLSGVADLQITSMATASDALSAIVTALDVVSAARSNMGAVISRLQFTIDNLANVLAKAQESRSRIEDTDYSQATTELAKRNIIQQAAQAMLAQANQAPQLVLQLLK